MTTEEIKAFMSENPDASKQILDGFKETHIIRTKDEDVSFMKGYEDDLLSKKTRSFAEDLENDILNTSGMEKQEGEKYYDYNKRVINSLLDKSKKAKSLEKQLEELKNSDVDEALKRELGEYKGIVEKMKADHEEKVVSLKKEFNMERKKSSVAGAMSELSFSSELPEDVISTMKESALNKVLSANSQFSDGQLVFLNENGETIRDQESMQPLTAKEILVQSLSSVLKKPEQKKTGLGTDAPKTDNGFTTPSGISTRMQLTTYLAEKGIAAGTAEYSKAWAEAGGNELPLR